MGILKPHIHLFRMEQKTSPITKGDLLTLGQQQVYCTMSEVKKAAGAVMEDSSPRGIREAAKKAAVTIGIPLPTNPWLRLILSFQFITLATRLVPILLDRVTKPKPWHPLWLNMYLFNRGRGGNIRLIAKYSTSGDIQLSHRKDLPSEKQVS